MVKTQKSFDSTPPRRTSVELRLETDMKSFKRGQVNFLAALARVLNVEPEEIRKIKVLQGCVRFIFDIPEGKADALMEALKKKPIPPELQAFLDAFNIDPRNTRFNLPKGDAPYVQRMKDISNELNKDGRVLTWLHLSDVHFHARQGAVKWNQDQVKEGFVKSLPKLLSEWGLSPDVVFFTGDVTYSGEEPQYKIAAEFFKKMKEGLKAPGLKIYVVPGNHDVMWAKIGALDGQLRERLSGTYEVNSYLLEDKFKTERDEDFSKFENFKSFLKQHLGGGAAALDGEYFFVDRFDHLGLSLGVAGLNSAWRSTNKEKPKPPGSGRRSKNRGSLQSYDPDLNNLILGEPQVLESVQAMESAQIRFALLHHPPHSMWFKDFDRKMQAALMPRFDFVLRGHEHETIAHTVLNINTDEEYVHIAGGALYDASEYKGKTGYPISFNAVRLNLDSGRGIIFYWRYITDLYGWRKDGFVAEDGLKVFDIPEKVLARVRNLSPSSGPNYSVAHAGS